MVEKKNSGKYLELMDFYDLLISGGSIQELADYMQEWLNNPVAVCNRNYDPIAIAGKGSEDAEIQDSNWTAFISGNLESHLNFVNQRYQAKAMYALPDSEVEVMEPTDSSDHRFISCALVWKDRFVGDILVLEYDQKFTERDLSVCAKMIDAIAYAITFHMDLNCIQESGEEELLSNLLNGNYVSADVITRYFSSIKTVSEMEIVVFELQDPNRTIKVLRSIRNMIRLKFTDTVSVFFKGRLVVLFKNMHTVPWNELESLTDSCGCLGGSSNPFRDFECLRMYYEQAVTALDFGKRYPTSQGTQTYFDIAPLHLLDLVSKTHAVDLRNFLHPTIPRVLDYDSQYHTNWMSTLFVYVYFNGDMKRTASVLGINKSSAHYRINKIREIAGHDLSSPYFFFHMRWGFNIMYFLEGEDMYTKYQLPKECPLFPKYDHIHYEADEIRTKGDSNQKP